MVETPLAKKMRELACNGHTRADELLKLAQELDDACADDFNAKRTVGAWARARRCWSECSGESLI